MPLPSYGGAVVLGGTTFNTDPDPYEHQIWPKRASYHKTIGGGQVIQDFGLRQTDLVLQLGSGEGQFIDEVVRAALNVLYATRGATWTLTDYLGNEFTVFIRNFQPTIFKMGGNATFTATQLYHYKMDLQVQSIQKLYNISYTGG